MIAETGSSKRRAVLGHEKGQMLVWGRLDDRCEFGMQRYGERGAGFLLSDVDGAVAYVLAAHADRIGAALPRAKQQLHRQARTRTDRMVRSVCRDIVLRPSINPFGAQLNVLDAKGRVVITQTDLLAKL